MNINRSSPDRRPGQQGFFLVVVMFILATIMLIYLAANSRRLANLKSEIRLVEQKQVQRLNRSTAGATNNISTPIAPSPSVP